MYQTWRDLLFLHWTMEPAAIQATLPDGLFVDTFEDRAYIGLVPFFMDRIRPSGLPALPWLSWFLEFNVRTYVHDQYGTPGVWFYSLDCNQPIAVWGARTLFKLPYFRSRMSAVQTELPDAGGRKTDYHSRRRIRADSNHGSHPPPSRFIYEPTGELTVAAPGSLEFFLVERYILFANTRRGLATGQVYHEPYQFCLASVSEFDTDVLALNELPKVEGDPVSCLYSPGVDVEVFSLQLLDRG
jgi:uncharacterized protein YqjF (DUF2071 family)